MRCSRCNKPYRRLGKCTNKMRQTRSVVPFMRGKGKGKAVTLRDNRPAACFMRCFVSSPPVCISSHQRPSTAGHCISWQSACRRHSLYKKRTDEGMKNALRRFVDENSGRQKRSCEVAFMRSTNWIGPCWTVLHPIRH